MELESYLRKISKGEIRNLSIRNFRRLILEGIERFAFKKTSKISIFSLPLLRIMRNSERFNSARLVLTRLFPWDPLIGQRSDDLEIYMLTTHKDIEVLPLSLASALQVSRGRICKLNVVGPASISTNVQQIINQSENRELIEFISDEAILKKADLSTADFIESHPLMLTIKYLCGYFSSSENNLILDADTVFLQPRNWAADQKSLLIVSQEYLLMHINYCKEIANLSMKSGIGFTTQSQLFRKQFIREIVDSFGGIANLSANFNDQYSDFINGKKKIFPAEWQLYCSWVLEKHPNTVFLALNSNIATKRHYLFNKLTDQSYNLKGILDQLNSLKAKFPYLGSISFHDYK